MSVTSDLLRLLTISSTHWFLWSIQTMIRPFLSAEVTFLYKAVLLVHRVPNYDMNGVLVSLHIDVYREPTLRLFRIVKLNDL